MDCAWNVFEAETTEPDESADRKIQIFLLFFERLQRHEIPAAVQVTTLLWISRLIKWPRIYENARLYIKLKYFQKIKSIIQNVPPLPFICSIKLRNQIHVSRVVTLYKITIFVASRCKMKHLVIIELIRQHGQACGIPPPRDQPHFYDWNEIYIFQ